MLEKASQFVPGVPAKTFNSHRTESFCPDVGNNYHCETPTEAAPCLRDREELGQDNKE